MFYRFFCTFIFLGWMSLTLILASTAYGQGNDLRSLKKSAALLDSSKPGLLVCLERSSDESGIRVRLTNNYVWTLQFPADNSGRHDGTRTLSNGQTYAILADNAAFDPYFWFESARNSRSHQGWRGHLATFEFLAPKRSATFLIPKLLSKAFRIYLQFNYEWELPTIYLAEPSHRLYIYLDSRSMENNRCSERSIIDSSR